MTEIRGQRLQIMLSLEELSLVDNFRFAHLMPTRAAAVRELMRLGLETNAVDGDGQKSSNYGVFARAVDGHRDGDQETDSEGRYE